MWSEKQLHLESTVSDGAAFLTKIIGLKKSEHPKRILRLVGV